MKKSFDVWLVTASTSDLEANLRVARTAREASRIREELKNRGVGLPDTGTPELFPTEKTGQAPPNAQRSITAVAILFCLAASAIAAPRTPIENGYLKTDLDANNKKITNLDASGSNLPPTTRTISTTAPLTGGGDLSANRTFGLAGLTGLGTANQLIGMNGGSGFEYKTLTTGTSGTDFGIAHTANTITFNMPTASAINRGALSAANWTAFNAKENVLTFTQSLSRSTNTITLVNDAASPGGSKYYGTDSGGTKGYFALSSGGDFSSNTSSSVDGELVLFAGTGGKTGKRATGNGVAHVTSGAYSASAVVENDITLADNTTNNASTSAHGLLKKLDNNAAHYMDGTGSWSTPAGSGGSGYWDSATVVTGSDATTTNTTATDVTGLTFAAAASSTYEIDAVIRTNSSSAAGMNLGVNYSAAGATLSAETTSVTTGTGGVTGLTTLGTPVIANSANNVDGVAVIRGFVITGANAGNITIIFSKVTSGTATVRTGSVFKVKKVI